MSRGYLIRENLGNINGRFTAANKAREDVEHVLLQNNYTPISIFTIDTAQRKKMGPIDKILAHKAIGDAWKAAFDRICWDINDMVWIQFLPTNHSIMIPSVVNKRHKKGVKTVLLIHDLDIIRFMAENNGDHMKRIRIRVEEIPMLKNADYIIAHNSKMKEALINIGIKESRVLSLEIFDYLMEYIQTPKRSIDSPIIIAGNLNEKKAGYVYDLPSDCKFNLYGVGYEDRKKENVAYMGTFPSDDLPQHLDGSFGLVWDGPSADTCEGASGSYLKVNNPHKTSLYLASGFTVIIWENAALAEFIKDNKCGFTVSSLGEIKNILNSISAEEYAQMLKNVDVIRRRLNTGYYMAKVIKQIEKMAQSAL